MKEYKMYQCEICNTQYKDRSDCETCEKNHVRPEGIKQCEYHMDQYFANYPDIITVLMKDGREIKYIRD